MRLESVEEIRAQGVTVYPHVVERAQPLDVSAFDVPAVAKWIAADADGEVYPYSEKPYPHKGFGGGGRWGYSSGELFDSNKFKLDTISMAGIDWRQTLTPVIVGLHATDARGILQSQEVPAVNVEQQPAQPWCAQCGLPEDICRGHEEPVTVVNKDQPRSKRRPLSFWPLCNFRKTDAGIEYCDGDHNPDEPCRWKLFTVKDINAMVAQADDDGACAAEPVQIVNCGTPVLTIEPARGILPGLTGGERSETAQRRLRGYNDEPVVPIPGDVAETLFAQHSASWCERLIDELLTLLEAAKDSERHARIWDRVTQHLQDDEDMAQLRVAQ